MPKRNRSPKTRRTNKRQHPRTAAQRPGRRDEPDLVRDIAAALDDGEPLTLLALASSLLAAVAPRRSSPFERAPDPELPSLEKLVGTFLDVELEETSALLAAIAGLSGDEMLRLRVQREITARAHTLPAWLAELHQARPADRAIEVVHVLGDGDNVIVGVRLPGGHELTAMVYIDHNMGTLVKDAFIVAEPLPELVERMMSVGADPDVAARDLGPALVGSLLWFGTDYGPGDPLRWSPTVVEILLADWIPRKIVSPADHLAKAPDLLRSFIRFSHHERGVRPALTDQTLAAVDEYEPDYQRVIRSPRPQGPAALLAALGALDPEP